MKLPKQWHHWCSLLNLRDTCNNRGLRGVYLRGRGRYWRINCYGEFQCSEVYETFDRWANSLEKSFELPTSFKELKNIVESV